MDYGHVDTSGTDDDLPPSHNNIHPRCGRVSGNGRSIIGSVPFPRLHSDMESQIHQLEQEAYSSVLRAFKAQSDALTWEKEGLITELRKELRVSDDEHRELLTRVNADDIICRIREWRQAGGLHGTMLSTTQPIHDLIPSPTAASRKKQKTSQSMPPSFGVPQRTLHAQYPSTGLMGRGQLTKRSYTSTVIRNRLSEAATNDPLVGRKVMTRWPEDNNFYEAVITDYNPIEGRHALVYDIHTAKETWEWVDLKEISPDDIRWVGEDPGISHQLARRVNNSVSHGVTQGAGVARGSANHQFKNDLSQLQNGVGRISDSDEIEILHTETLIKEVEKVFDASHPDLLEIEKAKKMLRVRTEMHPTEVSVGYSYCLALKAQLPLGMQEHERALIDVIAKLADASDSESGNKNACR